MCGGGAWFRCCVSPSGKGAAVIVAAGRGCADDVSTAAAGPAAVAKMLSGCSIAGCAWGWRQHACLPAAVPVLAQMPVQGAVTHLIVAPQGVLRNFYPLKGYCLDNCDDIHIDLFRSELLAVRRGRPLA